MHQNPRAIRLTLPGWYSWPAASFLVWSQEVQQQFWLCKPSHRELLNHTVHRAKGTLRALFTRKCTASTHSMTSWQVRRHCQFRGHHKTQRKRKKNFHCKSPHERFWHCTVGVVGSTFIMKETKSITAHGALKVQLHCTSKDHPLACVQAERNEY